MKTNKIQFIKNEEEISGNKNHTDQKFTVLLNGQKDLEEQLERFTRESKAHLENHNKRCKPRYYNLALMAEVDRSTTKQEIKSLLINNTRTFSIDVLSHKLNEVESLSELIRQVKSEQQLDEPNTLLTIGLALQILGDACRLGRIRNNCPLFLSRNDIITLTSNAAYRFASFKEIIFVANLQYYLPAIQIEDEIAIGAEVRGCVIKKLKAALAMRIEEIGVVNSYDLLELPNRCCNLELPELNCIFREDLEMAAKLQMDFITLPHVQSLRFLELLQQTIENKYKFKLIVRLDLEYISRKMLDVTFIMKHLDYLWLTDLFSRNIFSNLVLKQSVTSVAKCFKKPIIASVCLEHGKGYKLHDNQELLRKIDCIFIAKSTGCHTYPLIVKKLLPIRNNQLCAVEDTAAILDILTNCSSIVNFIILTISSIECQAIFLHTTTKCEMAAKSLSRAEIYCPVYVLILLDESSENNREQINVHLQRIRNFNLRRNLRSIAYTKEMNELGYKAIDYGIEYVRQSGCLETGDFIITLEIGKECGEEHVQLGVEEAVVMMRAIYVPPVNVGEKCLEKCV